MSISFNLRNSCVMDLILGIIGWNLPFTQDVPDFKMLSILYEENAMELETRFFIIN